MALRKALWKLRPPGEPEPPGARFVRRWREKRLLARLETEWPGGFALHRTGDLVYVPRPLDARGRHALLHPPQVHPAVLRFVQPGSVVIDVGANLGEWTIPFARAVGPAGRVIAIEPGPPRFSTGIARSWWSRPGTRARRIVRPFATGCTRYATGCSASCSITEWRRPIGRLMPRSTRRFGRATPITCCWCRSKKAQPPSL